VYSDFTPAFQHEQGSATSFTGVFGQGLRVTQCVPSLHTYRLATDDRSATMAISLTVTSSVAHTSGVTQTFTETAQVVCVRSASGWLIDTLTLHQ